MSSARCKALLAWYQQHARQLPWRETQSTYHIWISEIMLQQTQVKTVLPRYAGWFERFPSIDALANAGLDDVLKAWEGLGYYRRARFIHQASQQIVTLHNGVFPVDFADILQLPGIGRSTAGAISSFCFGTATPVLDGNVKRVLRRWHALPDADDKALWRLAQQAIDLSADATSWNQTMMELGATLCSAKKADCTVCPVAALCQSAFSAHATNNVSSNAKSLRVKNLHWQVHLHLCPQRGIWLLRRPDHGIWGGLWTPPITELDQQPDIKPCHIHLLTHRRLHLYATKIAEPQPDRDGCWVATLSEIALPTGIHRLLAKHEVLL